MNVVKARQTDKGIIIHEYGDGSSKEYQGVRGGITWPIMNVAQPASAYYCIFGEEHVETTHFQGEELPRGKLVLLNEHQSLGILALDEFYTKLTYDLIRYACGILYGITEKFQGKDFSGYADALQKMMHKMGASCSLLDPPCVDEPDIGMYHIKFWERRGLLDLPKGSIVREQLKMVTPDLLNDLPHKLNAVNALRFVLSGLALHLPTSYSRNWRKKMPKGTWRSA